MAELPRPQPVYPFHMPTTFSFPGMPGTSTADFYSFLCQPVLSAVGPQTTTELNPKSNEERPASPSVDTCSSRCSSTESAKIRRGRPQQDIEDNDDPQSQKKRHRRMYARKYRAQMRRKVDNVPMLVQELEELRNQVKQLKSELKSSQLAVCQRDVLIGELLSGCVKLSL
ncbi:unnamed protein product [Caenorhabditis auriculariae]|uniref:BZIP domain-containing protein n=1 Tax=Caenorhabditis auriculariae TaxID=2777116 RepID=A0A8S1HK72_9PELO|nr:unnamed protein product [Caenorhabditis auriculariae]